MTQLPFRVSFLLAAVVASAAAFTGDSSLVVTTGHRRRYIPAVVPSVHSFHHCLLLPRNAISRNDWINTMATKSKDVTTLRIGNYIKTVSSLSSNMRNNDHDEQPGSYNNNNNNNNDDDLCDTPEEEELSETQQLMARVKEAGTAGVVSYAFWELAFWCLSVPVCVVGYKSVTGHWPDLSNAEDQKQLGAEAFAFVNVARFAVPLRIGLALSTTGWVQENVLDRFNSKKDTVQDDCMVGDSFGDDDDDYGYDDVAYSYYDNYSDDDIAYNTNMRQLSGDYQKRLITRR